MKKIFIPLLILLNACSADHSLIGVWETEHYKFIKRCKMVLKGQSYMHTQLILYPDSSFIFSGSCEVTNGKKWFVKGDSLFLCVDDSWLKGVDRSQDSIYHLQRSGFMKLRIRNGKLERHMHGIQHTQHADGTIQVEQLKGYDRLELKTKM